MKEFKGTPGKWRNRDLSIFTQHTDQKIAVCEIINDNYDDESLSNAKLLAKAPELLASLQKMTWLFEAMCTQHPLLNTQDAYIEAKKLIEEAL